MKRWTHLGSAALLWLVATIGMGFIFKIYWKALLFGWNLIS